MSESESLTPIAGPLVANEVNAKANTAINRAIEKCKEVKGPATFYADVQKHMTDGLTAPLHRAFNDPLCQTYAETYLAVCQLISSSIHVSADFKNYYGREDLERAKRVSYRLLCESPALLLPRNAAKAEEILNSPKPQAYAAVYTTHEPAIFAILSRAFNDIKAELNKSIGGSGGSEWLNEVMAKHAEDAVRLMRVAQNNIAKAVSDRKAFGDSRSTLAAFKAILETKKEEVGRAKELLREHFKVPEDVKRANLYDSDVLKELTLRYVAKVNDLKGNEPYADGEDVISEEQGSEVEEHLLERPHLGEDPEEVEARAGDYLEHYLDRIEDNWECLQERVTEPGAEEEFVWKFMYFNEDIRLLESILSQFARQTEVEGLLLKLMRVVNRQGELLNEMEAHVDSVESYINAISRETEEPVSGKVSARR